jgi:hypothetical protein
MPGPGKKAGKRSGVSKASRPKATARATKSPAAPKAAPESTPRVRDGGQRVEVFNSGLEVWIYDEANLKAIRAGATKSDPGAGGMPGDFEKSTGKGLVVGYSLYQDDGIFAEVHVGDAFRVRELEVGRWLEPQTAFLRVPSGRLCIESNDASRLGPEPPGEAGAKVEVPPGEYRLTLLRVDHEALDREGISWKGPQELILLTPGGTKADAASGLLPFEQRRDTSWVGRYTINGSRADVLVWLGDYWDTFFVNLDANACAKLGLAAGRHFRTHVPSAGLTMISVFGSSWQEARKLEPPSGVSLDEYGYGAVITPQDWAPHEALFCKRDSAKKRAEDGVQNLWLEATVELLDPSDHAPKAASPEAALITLAEKSFFEDSFIAAVLGELLPGVDDLDELAFPDAIVRFDRALARMKLTPQGDIGWVQRDGAREAEFGLRLYTGMPTAFAAILASDANLEFVFLSELAGGKWIATGITDQLQRRAMRRNDRGIPVEHPTIRLVEADAPVARIRDAHLKAVGKAETVEAPTDLLSAAQAFSRFFEAATRG